ncbi:MAG: ethanolamine ammonia-lyase reactivating factor EutA [Clostridia bacterium]
MHQEHLLSVGIDVGTSTTQCVFSELCLTNMAPAFAMPKVQITEKKVLCRCKLRLTPLRGMDEIDAEKLRTMIEEDYRDAGMRPQDIRCGSIIVTGETARKQNARAVSQALSALAGEFVVATAGPDLESILAGRGSGAAALSSELGKRVLNMDIGGGTTNMCLFVQGEPEQTANLDIGGRLLRFEPDMHTVLSVSPKLLLVAEDIGLRIGQQLSDVEISLLSARMARVLEEALNLRPRTGLYERLVLERGFTPDMRADVYTFSGGVADCVYGAAEKGIAFEDIGMALGAAIRATACFGEGRVLRPKETQQATVIGAGAYSMTVSGSTIQYGGITFPIKNLPAGKIRFASAEDIPALCERILEQCRIFDGECAIAFTGLEQPTFQQIEAAADELARALRIAPLHVLIMERDMAKALGQALTRRLGDVPLVCIDGIPLAHGDMVDIGAPLSEGRVLPIVVKTLAFLS